MAMTGFTEDELVEVIRRILADDVPGVRLGVGDDAAVVEIGGHHAVLTTDMLVEDVHFRRGAMAPRDLGAKSLTVNVSDVAAMGGSPRFALMSLGVPPDTELPWLVELYGGLRDAAADYGMSVVGGDTSRSERVVISVTVVGEVARGGAVPRSGASPGDRLVVTGALGGAAGGLRLAEADPRVASPSLATEWGRELLERLQRPVARVGEGQTLAQAGATAMMDLSDGLAIDLSRLCRESEVGAVVVLADVPVIPALEHLREAMAIDPVEMALSGGEDYELLAAIPHKAVGRATAKLRERFGTTLTDIGEVTAERGLVAVEPDGSRSPLEPRGWDHFGA